MMNLTKILVMVPTLLLMSYTQTIASDLQVQVIKQSDWNTGFCSNVSVYNPTNKRELWDISFDAEGVITSLWSANYTQNSTTLHVTASGLNWNQYVEPHDSVVLGYCANKVKTAPTTPPPPNSGDLVVTETSNAHWDGGFCKNVQVKNNSDHPIDWQVNFPINGVVTTSWNSNFSQNPETLEGTTSGVDWNNIVEPNAQVEFGYCANEVVSTPESTTTSTPEPTITSTPEPTTISTPEPTTTSTPEPTTTSTKGHFAVGYLPSWSTPWFSDTNYAESQIATVNNLYTHIVISFAQPDLTFNGTDWSGTGIQFSSDIRAVKKAIESLQARGVKVILAVGGASYNSWSGIASEQGKDITTTTHKKALKALIDTLNLDGIDVDYEIMGDDSANVEQYYKSILALKEVAGDKLFTVAGWSTGADCTANTTESTGCDDRVSWWGGSAGRERLVFDMLKANGQNADDIFDYVSVMSYDGGVNRFDPIRFFKNYQEIYNGAIALGFEIPTEGWGGAEIVATNAEAQGCESSSMISGDSYNMSTTKEAYSVERFVDFVNSVPNSGVMVWSLYKDKDNTNCDNALDFENFNSEVKSRLRNLQRIIIPKKQI